jgi:tetratricopeptide (TPR) repeat protein
MFGLLRPASELNPEEKPDEDENQSQGRFTKAARLYRQALRSVIVAQGPEHPSVYRRALVLKEKLLGANHPDVALTLNNLAVLCKQEGRYDKAAALYQRALAV